MLDPAINGWAIFGKGCNLVAVENGGLTYCFHYFHRRGRLFEVFCRIPIFSAVFLTGKRSLPTGKERFPLGVLPFPMGFIIFLMGNRCKLTDYVRN
jgi:hypothetical protein